MGYVFVAQKTNVEQNLVFIPSKVVQLYIVMSWLTRALQNPLTAHTAEKKQPAKANR